MSPLLLPLLLACSSVDPAGDSGTAPGGTDGGSTDGGGADGGTDGGSSMDCTLDADAFSSLAANTVRASVALEATWQTALSGASIVRFTDGSITLEAPAEDGRAVLVGAGPLSPVTWTVRVDTDDGPICSAPQEALSGGVDPEIPQRTVTLADGHTPTDEVSVLPVVLEGTRFAVIIDALGRIVWSRELDTATYKVAMARGRGAVLAGGVAWKKEADAEILRLGLDGEVQETLVIPGGHTDFVELPTGELAMLGWEIRSYGDRQLLGDTILERDLAGNIKTLWSVYDALEPDLSQVYDSDFYAADPSVEDWSHINSISYDPVDDNYLVTMTQGFLVIAVSRSTGQMLWSAGSQGNTLITTDDLVDKPHGAQRLDDGSYLVFNRGKDTCSAVVHFEVDHDAGTATETGRYEGEGCMEVHFLGGAEGQSDGRTVIAWSSAGRLEEIDADQQTLRQVDLDLGGVFGLLDVAEGIYP